MIWVKRRFAYADYAPYQDRMEKLLMANAPLYQQFLMVSTKADDPDVSTYYVGVQSESFPVGFGGFERVSEDALPKQIDVLHLLAVCRGPNPHRILKTTAALMQLSERY